MLEPVTTVTALFAAGAWFSHKILGPAADSLGEELKIYSSERWKKIFKRAEELASEEKIEPIKPAIAYAALKEASLSDDEEQITDMWAQLFLDAASGANRPHRLFVDILAHLKADDAIYIDSLTKLFLMDKFNIDRRFIEDYRILIKDHIESIVERSIIERSEISLIRKISDYRGEEIGWPSEVVSFEGRLVGPSGVQRFNSGSGLNVSLDTLIRERILDFVEVNVVRADLRLSVQAVALTKLGLQFVIACRGRHKE